MFLATTALSEFWKPEEEILFLGRWCLRYDRRPEWERLRYRLLPSPWDDRERFYEAVRYLEACEERILDRLSAYLNDVHRVSHSRRYWRILIGPWVLYYVHAAYDRYVHLADALQGYPGLQTLGLDPSVFRVPRDTLETDQWIGEDAYNLQLFTQLLRGMGVAFPTIRGGLGSRPADHQLRPRGGSGFKAPARFLERAAGEVLLRLQHGRARWGLCDLYCPRSMTWTLAWNMRFRAVPLEVRRNWSFAVPAAKFDHRRMGMASLGSSDAFERLFVSTLPHHIPPLYLEGYDQANEEIARRYRRVPPGLVSANAWWFNEPFRFLAAEAVERSSRLIAVQHGGGYGIFRSAPLERHECRIADTFVTWGWRDKGDGRYRSLPHPALSSWLRMPSSGRRGASRRIGTILFVATGHPRYLYRFHSSPVGSQWAEYFDWQLRFFSALPESLRRHLVFRPYRYDYGHAARQRISECVAPIRWEATRPFSRLLRQARVVVIDHCATTYLEALVANIPTVLFWDPHRWELRADAESWFERLRRVGILWDAPEKAAEQVAQIYHEPTAWWESRAVQEARRSVVQRYAQARSDWQECWARALETIADEQTDLVSIHPSR